MLTETIRPYSCSSDTVQLEMVSQVSEIEPGQRVTWKSSGKQRFIHRSPPEIAIDPEGNVTASRGAEISVYNQVPDFKMSPRYVAFNRPGSYELCILEHVMHDALEQLMGNAALEVFSLSTYIEPLVINWPTFDEDSPLELTFYNPMERKLPYFQISIFLSVPADFSEHWRAS